MTSGDLPPPFRLADASGDWHAYLDEVFERFHADLVRSQACFQGLRVLTPRHPEDQGKHASFWHVTSEGDRGEHERTPDMRRCERIAWIRWTIENAGRDPRVSWWENERRTRRGPQTHVVLLVESERFVVVLARRSNADGERYLVLRTAYCVDRDHRLRRLIDERDAWRRRHGC